MLEIQGLNWWAVAAAALAFFGLVPAGRPMDLVPANGGISVIGRLAIAAWSSPSGDNRLIASPVPARRRIYISTKGRVSASESRTSRTSRIGYPVR